jgi:hypothetical protein
MEAIWSSGSHTSYCSCTPNSLECTSTDGPVFECRFFGCRISQNERSGSVKRRVETVLLVFTSGSGDEQTCILRFALGHPSTFCAILSSECRNLRPVSLSSDKIRQQPFDCAANRFAGKRQVRSRWRGSRERKAVPHLERH